MTSMTGPRPDEPPDGQLDGRLDGRGELRLDPLTREWVNIVGHRQARPNLPDAGCPFCVGGLEAPDPYDVRWFPNRWPAFAPGPAIESDLAAADGARVLPAAGACEVVLFSPEHDQSLATLGVAQVRKVIDLWAARTAALLERPEVEYVLVFENRGREVGATIDHPHGQIYGYPFVPPAPAREAAVAREHGCAVCAEFEAELKTGDRVVTTAGDWVAWVPFASTYPYGMRFASRAHVGSLTALDDTQRDELARLLVDALARYDRLWTAPHAGYLFPYLLWFHQEPAAGGDEWHLHAHVAPPLREAGVQRYVASGELGSGTLSNPVVPEMAARALRDA
jgi:UDPglucose--hexose-1-phosphate uridylyltransferase